MRGRKARAVALILVAVSAAAGLIAIAGVNYHLPPQHLDEA